MKYKYPEIGVTVWKLGRDMEGIDMIFQTSFGLYENHYSQWMKTLFPTREMAWNKLIEKEKKR